MTVITGPGSRPVAVANTEPASAKLIGKMWVKPQVGDDFGGAGTHSQYKATLRGQTDAQLKGEIGRLEATIRDASSGPNKNPGVAARARAELGEVREEQATRAGFAKSTNPAYSQQVHTMSDGQLAAERRRLTFQAAQTFNGPFNWKMATPAAQQAKAKLDILNKEQAGRAADAAQGALPTKTATKPMNIINEIGYHAGANRMTDEQIGTERAKVNAELIDATTGANTDPVAAANCRQKLSVLDHVMQTRHPQSTPATDADLASYGSSLHNQSDAQLNSERTRLTEAVQNWQSNPVGANNARRQLAALDTEVSAREVHRVQFGQEVRGMSDEQLNALATQKDAQLHSWFGGKGMNRRELGEDLQTIKFEQFKRHWGIQQPPTAPPAPLPPAPQTPYQGMDTQTLVKDLLTQIDRYKQAAQPKNGIFPDFATMQDAATKIQQGLSELLNRLHGEATPQPTNPYGYPPGYKSPGGGDVHKMNVELPVGGGPIYKIQADQPTPGPITKMNVELPVGGGPIFKIQADQPVPAPRYEKMNVELPIGGGGVVKIKADEPTT